MKEQKKNAEKELNEKQPIRWRVQNTGDQDAQRTHWVQKQYKKDQEKIKGTLSEIKKNLQGSNSGKDEARTQINDLNKSKK